MDTNTILHTDPEPYRDLFFLSAIAERRRPALVKFAWAAPQPCSTCPGGRHYATVVVHASLN